MSQSSERILTLVEEAPDLLRWRSWPLGESLWRSCLLAIALGAVTLAVCVSTGRVSLGVLALAVLLLALWRYFLPVEFELNGKGVDQYVFGRRRRLPWSAIGCYEICSAGILLLPSADCRLGAMRGLYLPWGKHRHEVILRVRYYISP